VKSNVGVLALAADVIAEQGAAFDVDSASSELARRMTWAVLSDPLSLSLIAKILIREAARRTSSGAVRTWENVERTNDDGEPTRVYKQFALFSGEERLFVWSDTRAQAERLVAKVNRMRRVIEKRDGVTLPELRLVEVTEQ